MCSIYAITCVLQILAREFVSCSHSVIDLEYGDIDWIPWWSHVLYSLLLCEHCQYHMHSWVMNNNKFVINLFIGCSLYGQRLHLLLHVNSWKFMQWFVLCNYASNILHYTCVCGEMQVCYIIKRFSSI